MIHGKCLYGSRLGFCTLGSSIPLQASICPDQRGSTQSRTLRPAHWKLKSTLLRSLTLMMMMILMLTLLSRKCR